MNTLKAERRDLAEKAKKLRREGFVTGNVFGHQIQGSIPVKMNRPEVEKLLKEHGKGSKLTLELERKTYPVLIKEVQFNTLKGQFDEVDFQALVSDEMIRSVAEIQIYNHDKVREGVLQQELTEVSYSALPADLVEKVVIDAKNLKVGDTVTVGDLELAKNPKIHLHTDLHSVIVTVTAVSAAAETEAESEDAEAPAASAE